MYNILMNSSKLEKMATEMIRKSEVGEKKRRGGYGNTRMAGKAAHISFKKKLY